jgi:hypothetical protein
MPNSGLRIGHKALVSDFDAIGLWVLKTSTESVTSSITLQNDDQLALPMSANAKYSFDAYIIYDGSASFDLRAGFTVPSGAAITWSAFGPQSGVGVTSLNANAVVTSGGALGLACGGAGTSLGAGPRGYVSTAGTSGNLQFQFAQMVSGATATRVFLGSWLRLTRIA